MKKILLTLALCLFATCEVEGGHREPERVKAGLSIMNLSATSDRSFEDAMNKFSQIQPKGYVIESIKYHRSGRFYTVFVKIRRIS